MSRRPDVIVAGRIIVTAIPMANRTKGQLILILRAVSGDMSWLATLEAQSILRTERCNVGLGSFSFWLPRRWRRQTRCNIGGPWSRGRRSGYKILTNLLVLVIQYEDEE